MLWFYGKMQKKSISQRSMKERGSFFENTIFFSYRTDPNDLGIV